MKNGRRFLLRLCLALPACLGQSLAQAQFDKTPWPRTQATPAIDMVDLDGRRWTSADLKGRVVVLNFWATWCGPCREEMLSLQALHALDPKEVVVIAVNVKESDSTVQRFVTAQALTLPVVRDPQGELTRRWGVRIYPTTFLIDPAGQARWRVVGEVDWAETKALDWLSSLARPAR